MLSRQRPLALARPEDPETQPPYPHKEGERPMREIAKASRHFLRWCFFSLLICSFPLTSRHSSSFSSFQFSHAPQFFKNLWSSVINRTTSLFKYGRGRNPQLLKRRDSYELNPGSHWLWYQAPAHARCWGQQNDPIHPHAKTHQPLSDWWICSPEGTMKGGNAMNVNRLAAKRALDLQRSAGIFDHPQHD